MKRSYLNIIITAVFLVAFGIACLFISAWQSTLVVEPSEPKVHIHQYEPVIAAPTCTERGYTTYTCTCGEFYVADYVPVAEHSFIEDACEYCGLLNEDIPYIELNSADDIYALGRIFASWRVKSELYGEDYTITQDLSRFTYPEDVTEDTAKIQYLETAAYKLTSDIELTLNYTRDASYFPGIGSDHYPFRGIFDGNGKTITLNANGTIALSDYAEHRMGIFGTAQNARIANVNVVVAGDILVSKCSYMVMFGALVGFAEESQITNCTLTVADARMGVSFREGETDIHQVHLGGLVGECAFTVLRNSTVTLTDATLVAQGYDVSKYDSMYAFFSVGGVLGFARAGSNSEDDIGQSGVQIYDCSFLSSNKEQQDVLFASVETGDELTVGGLVGCTFNNFVAKNCSVEISKGNIIAQKTGETDYYTYGTTVGGFVGRLGHTNELFNCTVNGDYLNIIARSPENLCFAGGIAGYDAGPWHKEVISLDHCSINGNGTSTVTLEITPDKTVEKWNALGGIVGCGSYVIADCSVEGITLVNTSPSMKRMYVGGICGIIDYSDFWNRKTYFTPSSYSGLRDCSAYDLQFDTARIAVVEGSIAHRYVHSLQPVATEPEEEET